MFGEFRSKNLAHRSLWLNDYDAPIGARPHQLFEPLEHFLWLVALGTGRLQQRGQ